MAQITEVRVRLVEGAGKVNAVASVTLDGEFVAMPATKTGGGGYRDTFHPVSTEARDRLLGAVCKAYVEAGVRAAEAPKKGRTKKDG